MDQKLLSDLQREQVEEDEWLREEYYCNPYWKNDSDYADRTGSSYPPFPNS